MVHSVFIQKDYKAHRETVLYERELTMLPETQVYADNIILINELRDKRANFFEEKSYCRWARLGGCSDISQVTTIAEVGFMR